MAMQNIYIRFYAGPIGIFICGQTDIRRSRWRSFWDGPIAGMGAGYDGENHRMRRCRRETIDEQ